MSQFAFVGTSDPSNWTGPMCQGALGASLFLLVACAPPTAAVTDVPEEDMSSLPPTRRPDANERSADAAADALALSPRAPDVAQTMDLAPVDVADASADTTRDVAPAVADARVPDARLADAAPVAPATCNLGAFVACGGDLLGTWDIAAFCEGGTLAAMGHVTFKADKTYSFLVLASQGENFMASPTKPEEGTWAVDGTRVMLKRTQSNGASFPNRGSLSYRTDLGRTSPFCVKDGMLELDAGRLPKTQSWLFRKRP